MDKFDVYAIGNAMVDYEIEVDDAFLSRHDVEKGLTTLVEVDRQQELLEAAKTRIIKRQGGGSAANTMVAFSQLGGNGFYSCRVASDGDGTFYLEDLIQNGLKTNLSVESLPEGVTGKCLVMISPDAERTMNTYLGITTNFSPDDIKVDSLVNSDYLYIEGALIAGPTGRAAMHEAKKIAEQNNVKVSLTLWDPAMVKYFGKEMHELADSGVDLLFCNEEEAMLYTGKDNLEKAREDLKKIAERFVITQGKNGATIWDGDTFVDIEPYPVRAIDSTGAGDMFAGAFLFGISNGHTYASSGKLASKLSSEVVSLYGPRLEKSRINELKQIVFGNQ